MRNFTRLRDAYNLDYAVVHVECPCLLTTDYDGLSAFLDAGGAIASENPLLVKCPRCERVYSGDAAYEKGPDSSEDAVKPTLGLSLTAGADADVPALPLGNCPSCEGDVYAEHYTEGPGHPEVGWSHYECPDCGTGISPRRFDDVRAPGTPQTEGE